VKEWYTKNNKGSIIYRWMVEEFAGGLSKVIKPLYCVGPKNKQIIA